MCVLIQKQGYLYKVVSINTKNRATTLNSDNMNNCL